MRDTLGTLRARLEIVKKAHAELWEEKEQLRRRAEVAEAALQDIACNTDDPTAETVARKALAARVVVEEKANAK